MSRATIAGWLGLFGSLSACSSPSGSTADQAGSAAATASASVSSEQALRGLQKAEIARAAALIGEPDLSSRNVAVRRRAALALARIANAEARPLLVRALSDEDPEVIALAAYGLGFRCVEAREDNAQALAARAVSLSADARKVALVPIARAIGRCASAASELTLLAWLDGDEVQAGAAALGLGELASVNKKLREDTLVALFSRAEGGVSTTPLPEALFPVSRLDNVPPSVTQRLAQVAAAALSEVGPYRLFAIRALGRARESGLVGLERVLSSEPGVFSMPERVEAARSAQRLGTEGQVLIGRAIELLAKNLNPLRSAGDDSAVMMALLSSHKERTAPPGSLEALADLTPADTAGPRDRRVVSSIRCAAARALQSKQPESARLLACDLDNGSLGRRALVQVLAEVELKGARAKAFAELAADDDVLVREEVLGALATHPEFLGACEVLLASLAHKAPGVVSTAAETLKKNPNLCSQKTAKSTKKNPKKDAEPSPLSLQADPRVVSALQKSLERGTAEHDPELLAASIDALGALGDPSSAAKIEPFCQSSIGVLRERAEDALTLLRSKKQTCPVPPPDLDVALPGELPKAKLQLVFSTEAGELSITLDPEVAPMTTLRIGDLVRRGYYNGTIIHRVDPSFVVQFGSPFGDGFGGPSDLPPLRCETSPRPFDTLDVGLALSGRDTGSSQLFVMRSRHPHLDGQYPWVGHASGPWDQVVAGDVISKARVLESASP